MNEKSRNDFTTSQPLSAPRIIPKIPMQNFFGKDSILLIVEGNSASSNIVKARDYTKYGVFAIRGKIINPLSNNEEDIFEKEEIKLLLSAMNIVPR